MVCNCLRHQVQQREQATKAAVDSQEEAQILPLMAQAAAKGGGVEYDKYEAMLDQMATIKFAKDECVFRQGDAATSVYLVTNGQLEVVTVNVNGQLEVVTDAGGKGGGGGSSGGKGGSGGGGGSSGSSGGINGSGEAHGKASASGERVIASLGPGDHFGETALLEERSIRNATVRCISGACELKAMPNEKFAKCLKESSQLQHAIHAAAETRT